jgi:hypothetical protein
MVTTSIITPHSFACLQAIAVRVSSSCQRLAYLLDFVAQIWCSPKANATPSQVAYAPELELGQNLSEQTELEYRMNASLMNAAQCDPNATRHTSIAAGD